MATKQELDGPLYLNLDVSMVKNYLYNTLDLRKLYVLRNNSIYERSQNRPTVELKDAKSKPKWKIALFLAAVIMAFLCGGNIALYLSCHCPCVEKEAVKNQSDDTVYSIPTNTPYRADKEQVRHINATPGANSNNGMKVNSITTTDRIAVFKSVTPRCDCNFHYLTQKSLLNITDMTFFESKIYVTNATNMATYSMRHRKLREARPTITNHPSPILGMAVTPYIGPKDYAVYLYLRYYNDIGQFAISPHNVIISTKKLKPKFRPVAITTHMNTYLYVLSDNGEILIYSDVAGLDCERYVLKTELSKTFISNQNTVASFAYFLTKELIFISQIMRNITIEAKAQDLYWVGHVLHIYNAKQNYFVTYDMNKDSYGKCKTSLRNIKMLSYEHEDRRLTTTDGSNVSVYYCN